MGFTAKPLAGMDPMVSPIDANAATALLETTSRLIVAIAAIVVTTAPTTFIVVTVATSPVTINISRVAVAMTTAKTTPNVSIARLNTVTVFVAAMEETSFVSTGPTNVDSPIRPSVVTARPCLP